MNTDAEGRYINAVSDIDDVRRADSDTNLAGMKADLLRGGIDGCAATSIDVVRALQLVGIAGGVADLFQNQSAMHHQATVASYGANALLYSITARYRKSGGNCRSVLPRYIGWAHSTPVLFDGTPAAGSDDSSYLFPITAYLQTILRYTPMDKWLTAGKATDSPSSPLAWAWVWARETPAIGRRTADVAALVAMGYTVNRLVIEAKEQEEKRLEKERQSQGPWAAITS